MKKNIILLCLMLLVLSTAVFAGDIKFEFEDARFHSDYLFGLAPFYLRAGIDYTGLELIKDQKTDLYVIGGGALISSNLWTDQLGTPVLPSDLSDPENFADWNSYSKWQGDFSLKLKQGLIQEEGREELKPLLAVYAKYGFHYTDPHENAAGSKSFFFQGSEAVYPDKNGTISNIMQLGVEIDRMDHTDLYSGFNINASVIYAPEWFFNSFKGRTDFYSANVTFEGYLPIAELKWDDSDLTMFGLYLADRLIADYTNGSAIPQFYQESPALGSKLRGFDGNSFGTNFTIANNFDIRIYALEFLDNINPVLNIFFDAGYYAGNYYNTDYSKSGILCSAGAQIALNVFDFAQLGYTFAWPLVGMPDGEIKMRSGLMLLYKF